MSDITKKYTKLSHLFATLSIVLTIFPIFVYVILAFAKGQVQQKMTLGITVTISLLLVAINMVFKYHLRSTLWILTLGIYFCIDNIMPLLLMVAIGTIVDEFILTPLHKSYKSKANINKEIDKRTE